MSAKQTFWLVGTKDSPKRNSWEAMGATREDLEAFVASSGRTDLTEFKKVEASTR